MNKVFKRLLLQSAISLCGLAVATHAGAINCYSDYVVDVAVDYTGTVWLTTNRVPLNAICNVSAKSSFTMDVPTCNAAFAMFVSAKVSGRPISIQYASGDCAVPGKFSAYYVQLN